MNPRNENTTNHPVATNEPCVTIPLHGARAIFQVSALREEEGAVEEEVVFELQSLTVVGGQNVQALLSDLQKR